MLVVLFIVMMISVISAGFIARSDVAMHSGYNYAQRCETDALAWGGLEHARALVVADPAADWAPPGRWQDDGTSLFYNLSITTLSEGCVDPNTPAPYTYSVHCSAYRDKGGTAVNKSTLEATLLYDPNTLQADYISIRRPGNVL